MLACRVADIQTSVSASGFAGAGGIAINASGGDEQTAQTLISALRDMTSELEAQLEHSFSNMMDNRDNALIR